jgi:hypothetical protein
MRAAKVRRRRILANLYDPAANGAGAREMSEQGFAIAAPDGAGEAG